MTEWAIASTLGTVVGGAFIWFAKDWIQKKVIGAEALAAKFEAKARAIKAAV